MVGHILVQQVLCGLLESIGKQTALTRAEAEGIDRLIAELRVEHSDDCGEEEDAIDLLNEYVADHYCWEMETGDLLLCQCEPLFDHMAEPDDDGRHPDYPHLCLFEVERHYGSLILTSQSAPGSALISCWEDWKGMVGDDIQADQEFAYLSDEYLDCLEEAEA